MENYWLNLQLTDLNPLFFGRQQCVPSWSYGPAVRTHTVIHYVSRGGGYLYKEENTYHIQAGQAFIIFPGEQVTYTADASDPWYYQWIAFDGKLSDRFRELPDVIPNFPVEIMDELFDIFDHGASEYYAASILFRLYAHFFQKEEKGNRHVLRAQEIIRARFMQPLKIEDIAKKLHLDRRYLSWLFKKETGESIQDFLISARMEEAKKLLLKDLSVESTARYCGYESACNFSRMFKRRFGLSPQEWKKKKFRKLKQK